MNGRCPGDQMAKCRLVGIPAVITFLASLLPMPGLSAPSPTSFQVRPWEVGQSITLQTKTYKNKDLAYTETTTFSIVEEEQVHGRNYFWVEIENVREKGVTITQKLQVRKPDTFDYLNLMTQQGEVLKPRRKLQKIVIGPTRNQSSFAEQEMDVETVQMVEGNPIPPVGADVLGSFEIADGGRVRVEAGRFDTIRFQRRFVPDPVPDTTSPPEEVVQIGTSWGSSRAPIWGLVKQTLETKGPNGEDLLQETQLLSYKDVGAVSKLKRRPHKISRDLRKKLSDRHSRDWEKRRGNRSRNLGDRDGNVKNERRKEGKNLGDPSPKGPTSSTGGGKP